jgi:hypothetical protein
LKKQATRIVTIHVETPGRSASALDNLRTRKTKDLNRCEDLDLGQVRPNSIHGAFLKSTGLSVLWPIARLRLQRFPLLAAIGGCNTALSFKHGDGGIGLR